MPHTDAGLDPNEDAIRCRCNECDALFDESELVTIQYAEYAGGSMQEEYASPCCLSAWDYVDEEV